MQRELSVVARVSANPAALCALTSSIYVVDYTGSILVVESGSYRVRIFEAENDGTAHLIGSGSITVATH